MLRMWSDPFMNHIVLFHILFRIPNLVGWGTVGGVALVHFTDWRLFLDFVPYIKGKFKNDDEE